MFVPIDVAPFLWGWPARFMARMDGAGSAVVLRGPISDSAAGEGIDNPEAAARVPAGFPGLVWTNDIAAVKPMLGRAR